MSQAPSLIPNMSMHLSGGRANDIRPVAISTITVGNRQRRVDEEKVNQIHESLKREGLLQPIGVKRQKSGEPFLLVFGHHRLLAMMKLMEETPGDDVIAAVVFPEETTEEECKRYEIIENLARKELNAKEREAHTTLYAGLLKKDGRVVERRKAQAANQAVSKGAIAQPLGNSPKTVTEKVATDLGINRNSVSNRIKNAKKMAQSVGVTVENKTAETMTGDELVKIGEAALKVAEADKAEAKLKGKAARNINAHQPTKPTQVSARLDVADPAPFIEWCRNRIEGKHKPMSLDILKAYRTALDALIIEIEGR